jgi:uncharacterized membrane protein SpoIIM required for sporulation
MLESLLSPEKAEKRPYMMLFYAIALALVATGMALVVSGNNAGYLVIAFICIGAAPMMVRLIMIEEEEDEEVKGPEIGLLARHGDLFAVYGFYFIGIIAAISLVYVLLPPALEQPTFGPQLTELNAIKALATGHATSNCGFACLLTNNLTVLALELLFSFIFGAGAAYIITWNASIVGVLIGVTAKTAPGNPVLNYLVALPISLVKLFPHGFFEIGAYFFGGIAGGMLSALVIKGHWKNKTVIKDILTIVAIAVVMIVIGAVIESL